MALVVGAGCSLEAPTSLKLSSQYSTEVHDALVADGVIEAGECEQPEDLSLLADLVFERTGSQRDLVERLPRAKFRLARANDGYLDAAALMMEGAISCIVTLNYDLALTDAIRQLGGEDIDVVGGPETMAEFGSKAVIYLHGNVEERDGDRWIMRTSVLDAAWQDTWEQQVVNRLTGLPCLVFASLGSPAAVLTESVSRVLDIVSSAPSVYLVDPDDASQFSVDLALPDSRIVTLTWSNFMDRVSKRVARDCCEAIRASAQSLCEQDGRAISDGCFEDLISRFHAAGLRSLGNARAAWLCQPGPYCPDNHLARDLMAHLLLALGEVLSEPEYELRATGEGLIEIRINHAVRGYAMGLHGAGVKRWAAAEQALRATTEQMSVQPDLVLAAGFVGSRLDEPAPPDDIVCDRDDDDVVAARHTPKLVDIDEIRGSGKSFLDLAA